MVTPSAGTVVLVPFPFSNLSQSKLRPAVVLADADRGDWILCQVTSKSYSDPHSIQLDGGSFAQGSLHVISCARPGKLFTASQSLMVRRVGVLTDGALEQVVNAVVGLLRKALKP